MFPSRYRLEAQEAEAVVELAKRHQVGLEPAHPVSLFDIWSPNRLLPTEREMLVRKKAIVEAAKASNNASNLDAVKHVCTRLRRHLEACSLDQDWAKVFRSQFLTDEDQVLDDKIKVFLFGCWRRMEVALQDPEPDIKQCDIVRLLLFPSSEHNSE